MTIRRTLVSLAAAACVLAGCTDTPVAPLSPPPAPAHLLSGIEVNGVLQFIGAPDLLSPRHAEKRIVASQGGFVELNGFRVDIPAGALPQDTTVTIDLPTDALLAKRVVAEFGPHGVQFNTPVTLSFSLLGVSLNSSPIQVSRWETDHWVGIGGSVNLLGTRLSATTPHFSAYGGTIIMAGG